MHVRKAVFADREALAALHSASILGGCSGHYGPEQLKAWVGILEPSIYDQALRDKIFLVAEGRGRLLGLGMLDVDAAVLSAVYVDPRSVGRGVGSRLLGALESAATRRSLVVLTTFATLNARGFYARHGYERIGDARHTLPGGLELPCVEMSKNLSRSA